LQKRPTRSDVAKLSGVSVATVSYVVNKGPKKVSEETRQRVLQAIKKLDYRPNLIARSLKTRRTHIIGLVIPTIASPGMALMANIVHEMLLQHGYVVTIANTREDCGVESSALDLMLSQSVVGLIICPTACQESDALKRLKRHGVPIVFMDRHIPGFQADAVMTDNVKCTRQATDYLIRQGCRRILCISFSKRASSAIDRVEGYKQALQASGIALDPVMVLVVEDPTGMRAEQAFLAHIDTVGLPDGILCTTQEIGISVVKGLRRQGIPFSRQNLVVFDAEWAKLLELPLPVVEQRLSNVAEGAVRLLLLRLDGDESPFQMISVDAQLLVP
jgi:DNA-binding LacI/PurR family transcriptional regulator